MRPTIRNACRRDAPVLRRHRLHESVACDEPMPVTLVEEPDGLYLQCCATAVADTRMQVVTSDMLGVPRIVEERYEQPMAVTMCRWTPTCWDKP